MLVTEFEGAEEAVHELVELLVIVGCQKCPFAPYSNFPLLLDKRYLHLPWVLSPELLGRFEIAF